MHNVLAIWSSVLGIPSLRSATIRARSATRLDTVDRTAPAVPVAEVVSANDRAEAAIAALLGAAFFGDTAPAGMG
jgi:hypothetical protein